MIEQDMDVQKYVDEEILEKYGREAGLQTESQEPPPEDVKDELNDEPPIEDLNIEL